MSGALRLAKRLGLPWIPGFPVTVRPFSEYFRGFERVEAVQRIFGEKTGQVLKDLKVEFVRGGGYMGVNALNGHLIVNPKYLNSGDKIDIYLDVIHELVHVRQFMEGKDLFDSRYRYVERPTEIEAYRHAVGEARRLGLGEDRICEYLRAEWLSDEDLRRLASALGLSCGGAQESKGAKHRQK
ncbi:MAG: hypothetical protein QFX35_05880 [Candidatus Verstraetearchaeota archaeon]|nr:hypothetical protein [Candidatus Verstraetearchaeota archaeon]